MGIFSEKLIWCLFVGLSAVACTLLLFIGLTLYRAIRAAEIAREAARAPIIECASPQLQISAWVDADANGKRDPGEAPLRGVVVIIPTNHSTSDLEIGSYNLGGKTAADGFVPHAGMAPCNLRWQRATARVPDGYQPTTPTEIGEMRGDYAFGFQRVR